MPFVNINSKITMLTFLNYRISTNNITQFPISIKYEKYTRVDSRSKPVKQTTNLSEKSTEFVLIHPLFKLQKSVVFQRQSLTPSLYRNFSTRQDDNAIQFVSTPLKCMAGFGRPVSGVAPLCFGETRKYICMHLAFCETEVLCVSVLPTSPLLRRFAANLNGVRSMAKRARGPRCWRSENRVFQTISSFAGSTVNQCFFLSFRFSSILSFFIGKHVSPSIVFVFAKQASISAIREPVSPSYLYKTS